MPEFFETSAQGACFFAIMEEEGRKQVQLQWRWREFHAKFGNAFGWPRWAVVQGQWEVVTWSN